MSWMDQTAEQREKSNLPRFIARPPRPELPEDFREQREILYAWERSWQVVYGWSVKHELDKGWECRQIDAGRLIERTENYDAQDQARREQLEHWADAFIKDNGMHGLIWPEDREAVLRIVAKRLREASADGFLLRALEAGR